MKISPVVDVFFHTDGQTDGRTDGRTDGQTDMTRLMVAFHNFVHALQNSR
jgi:hypothetical protein